MLEAPSLNILMLLLELLSTPQGKTTTQHLTEVVGRRPDTCLSTIFGTKKDKWAGGNAFYLGRPVDPEVDIGIAHRTLPVGSKVVLQNVHKPDKWVIATVVDRGPYGALLKDGEEPRPGQICHTRKDGKTWCVKSKRSDPGRWRGCVDTTPKAAKIIEHNGFQRVRIWPIPGTKPKSIWDWPAYKEKGKKRRERIEKRKRRS